VNDVPEYAPRHRVTQQRPRRKVLRNALLLGALAIVGTGTVIAGGMATHHPAAASTQAVDTTPVTFSRVPATRTEGLSRSGSRMEMDSQKADTLGALGDSDSSAVSKKVDMLSGDPKSVAAALLGSFGWSGDQFSCLDSLWTRESNWNVYAANASSGAYGIPQALPGIKMESVGSDWRTNPVTQIKWGLGYIQERYGSPCNAWAHSEASGWY
jgi:hypothetical protein